MDALEEGITESQLKEWGAFFALEPWGSEAAFLRAGIVAAMIANAAPNRKAGARSLTPQDFVPKFGESGTRPDDGLDPRRVRAEFLAAFGGRIKRRSDDR